MGTSLRHQFLAGVGIGRGWPVMLPVYHVSRIFSVFFMHFMFISSRDFLCTSTIDKITLT